MKNEVTKKELLTLIELLPEQSFKEASSYLIYLILKTSEPDKITKSLVDFIQGNYMSFTSIEELKEYINQNS